MTEVCVVLGDITTTQVDAIVNAANASLLGGGGVDGAIHRAGGPSILDECRRLVSESGQGCAPGDAVTTGAGNLPARWVIHTVGPIWSSDKAEEHDSTLASAYRRSLEEARRVGASSVAFPNISTGVYGFPKPRAAAIAISSVDEFLGQDAGLQQVVFVCFDQENFDLYVAAGCSL